jgi:hypothetical protein
MGIETCWSRCSAGLSIAISRGDRPFLRLPAAFHVAFALLLLLLLLLLPWAAGPASIVVRGAF